MLRSLFYRLKLVLVLTVFFTHCQSRQYFLGKNTAEEVISSGPSSGQIESKETDERHVAVVKNEMGQQGLQSQQSNNIQQEESMKLESSQDKITEDVANIVRHNILFILNDKSLNINQNIINSCFLTLKEFKSNLNISFIREDEFDKIDKNSLSNFSIIIGPLNGDDGDLFKIAEKSKIKYISLNKKVDSFKSNKMYFRPTNIQRYGSLLDFLMSHNKTEIAFLLPSNQKANNFYENIIRVKEFKDLQLNIVNTEFYNENNKESIEKSLKKIKSSLEHNVFVNSALQRIKIDFKKLKKEEKKNLNENNMEFLDSKNIKRIAKTTDTIFIMANDTDYEYILSYINKEGLFDKNIFFITETRSIKNVSNKEHFKNFFFIWNNPFLKEEFDQKYYSNFNIQANEISYLIYDLLASMINWIEFDDKDDGFFAKDNPYYGIYGDFKFNSSVLRRFGVYKLDENLDFYLYYKPVIFFN